MFMAVRAPERGQLLGDNLQVGPGTQACALRAPAPKEGGSYVGTSHRGTRRYFTLLSPEVGPLGDRRERDGERDQRCSTAGRGATNEQDGQGDPAMSGRSAVTAAQGPQVLSLGEWPLDRARHGAASTIA